MKHKKLKIFIISILGVLIIAGGIFWYRGGFSTLTAWMNRDSSETVKNYDSLAVLAQKCGFKLGTVINYDNLSDDEFLKLVKAHFNSLTTGNEMKAYSLLDQSASQESEDGMPVMNYSQADEILDFAKENGMKMRGHTLVWDAYMLDWFFRKDYDTSQDYVDEATLKERLQTYIEDVVTHFEQKYPGVVYCWDVVNEAVGDNAEDYGADADTRHIRKTRGGEANKFYDILGDHYVELSFQYAKDAVEQLKLENPDTDIKLFYNDYNAFYEEKRDAICALVKSINSFDSEGRKLCDGVGMQGYIGGYGQQSGCMNDGDIDLIGAAIDKYGALDLEVQLTEMAVRNYEGDEKTVAEHAAFYRKLFELFVEKAAGGKGVLNGVSIWGLIDHPGMPKDDYGYAMNGPYCGLFDETYAVKDSFGQVYEVLKNAN